MLPQGAGYGVVIGVGFFFTLVMMGLTWIQNRYSRFDTKTSEEFNTASRSVKPGLIAAGIVSAWTWAATLLQSATVGYRSVTFFLALDEDWSNLYLDTELRVRSGTPQEPRFRS